MLQLFLDKLQCCVRRPPPGRRDSIFAGAISVPKSNGRSINSVTVLFEISMSCLPLGVACERDIIRDVSSYQKSLPGVANSRNRMQTHLPRFIKKLWELLRHDPDRSISPPWNINLAVAAWFVRSSGEMKRSHLLVIVGLMLMLSTYKWRANLTNAQSLQLC